MNENIISDSCFSSTKMVLLVPDTNTWLLFFIDLLEFLLLKRLIS